MNKSDISREIIEKLLDNGLVSLEFSDRDYLVGVNECADKIKSVLDNYMIIQGEEIK